LQSQLKTLQANPNANAGKITHLQGQISSLQAKQPQPPVGGTGTGSAGQGGLGAYTGGSPGTGASQTPMGNQNLAVGGANGLVGPNGANGISGLTASNLPGLAWQTQYGDLTTQNALAAQGLGGSAGPLAKALSDYNQGLAGTYYPQYYNMYLGGMSQGINAYSNYETGLQNALSGYGQYLGGLGNGINAYGGYMNSLGNAGTLYNNYLSNYPAYLSGAGNYVGALGNIAGMYQNAASMGANAAANAGTASIQTGQNMGNAIQNSGNALASGTLGSANAWSTGLTGLGSAFTNYNLLNSLYPNQSGPLSGLMSNITGGNGLNLGSTLAGLNSGISGLFNDLSLVQDL
jgi:hypothetical protein